jgi:hypothetical protein
VLGTHEGSNQGTQAVQSLPRPLSYKIWIRPHKDRYKKKKLIKNVYKKKHKINIFIPVPLPFQPRKNNY